MTNLVTLLLIIIVVTLIWRNGWIQKTFECFATTDDIYIIDDANRYLGVTPGQNTLTFVTDFAKRATFTIYKHDETTLALKLHRDWTDFTSVHDLKYVTVCLDPSTGCNQLLTLTNYSAFAPNSKLSVVADPVIKDKYRVSFADGSVFGIDSSNQAIKTSVGGVEVYLKSDNIQT